MSLPAAHIRPAPEAAGGFTLLELMVAVALFAAVGAVAYAGLRSGITMRETTAAQAADLAALQRAFSRMELDFAQLAERPTRDAQGDASPPFRLGGTARQPLLELVRGGRRNPAALRRADLQRLSYRFEAGTLYRSAWPQLDQVPGTEPLERALLHGVQRVQWRFADAAGNWHEEWPAARRSAAAGPLPAGVELILSLEDGGAFRRLFTSGVGP